MFHSTLYVTVNVNLHVNLNVNVNVNVHGCIQHGKTKHSAASDFLSCALVCLSVLCCPVCINHAMTTTDRLEVMMCTEMYDVITSCISVVVIAKLRGGENPCSSN